MKRANLSEEFLIFLVRYRPKPFDCPEWFTMDAHPQLVNEPVVFVLPKCGPFYVPPC